MKPFALNLSKFKKIAQDEKSTTLQHLEGHQFKVMHSKLPLHMKKQLEGLPMYNGGVAHYDDGSDKTVSHADAAPDQKPVDVNVNVAQPAQPGAVPASSQLTSPASEMAAAPIATTVTSGKRDSDLISQDQSANIPEAVRAEQEAAAQQRDIDIAKGSQIANIESGYNAALAKNQQNVTDAVNEMSAQTQHVASNIAAINPGHYMENKSAEGKVMTALGLIAGGISSGVTGGSNPAMDFLNKQIDRDVSAQVQNNENQKTVYGFYHQLYGDKVLAANLAKVTMGDIRLHQLATVAAQLGTPQAIANYNAARAAIAIKNHQLMLENAGRTGTLQMGPLTQAAPTQQGAESAQATPGAGAAEPAIGGAPAVDMMSKVASALGMHPSGQATEQDEAQKPKIYHVVTPDAQRRIAAMQYSTPADKNDYEKATTQLQAAQQAEKVLNGPKGDGVGGIHDLVQQMYKNMGSGSYLKGAGLHTREHGGEALEAVPWVGKGLKGALDLLPKDAATKQYETGKAALINDLGTALKDIVAPTDIENIVRPNLPALGDSPKDVADKEKAMVNSILKAVKTNMLEKKGALAK